MARRTGAVMLSSSMPARRKRFQKGSIQERKHGSTRVWLAQWWESGSRRSKVLGKCSLMTKGDASQALAKILEPLNAGALSGSSPLHTFGEFVQNEYLPRGRGKWKASTRLTNEQRIEQHLLPEFGNKILRSLKRSDLQTFLDEKAQTCSSSVVSHLRWDLSAIFSLAVSDGVMPHNPAAELYVPKECKPPKEKHVLSIAEVGVYLSVLPLRERLIARLALVEGMRPGEILALKWPAITNSLLVSQRLYNGKLDSPKNGRVRKGALSDGTLALLDQWRQLAQDPNGFVFPSEKLASPIQHKNVWYRNMFPKLKTVGLEWATFQVLRRTNATLSKSAGVDPKASADQRGHGLGVSMEVYTLADLPQMKAAVNQLDSLIGVIGVNELQAEPVSA